MCFTIFQNERTPFQALKTKSSKSQKNPLFSRGVNPWLWSKNGHFFNFFFQAKQAWKMSFKTFQNIKTPLWAKKTRSSKSRKIAIFPKGLTHGFGTKMAIFSTCFFLGNIGQENVFYDILERKNAFLGYKKRSSKSRRMAIFPTCLSHCFGPKIAIYPTSFFQVKEIRKMSFTIFQKEKTPI